MSLDKDTICAVATPPGKGGIGIVRLSGPDALAITRSILRLQPNDIINPRHAYYREFFDHQGDVLDEGVIIYFQSPHSFTGEDVVELQGHGGMVLMDLLLKCALQQGARLARPGEFSERAFLNDKLDLAQAEAIADLIDAASDQAARSAIRSLKGEFSRQIHDLVEELTALRIHVEAAIDFPEEEIDFLSDGVIESKTFILLSHLDVILNQARQGALLREGMTVVIAGRPNAGKSSLLNALAGHEAAIVTDIAGTTRDVLREHIHIDGMPLHIVDTAGLRQAPDVIEQEGIRRAMKEIENADHILFVYDASLESTHPENCVKEFFYPLPEPQRMLFIRNKIDLLDTRESLKEIVIDGDHYPVCEISAKGGRGIEALKDKLKQVMGFTSGGEGQFIARARHVDALNKAREYIDQALTQLTQSHAGELAAEDLRLAQRSLGEITGAVSADDLLGKIFSSFCIGK